MKVLLAILFYFVAIVVAKAQAEDIFISDSGTVGVGNEHLLMVGGNLINDGLIAQERNSSVHFFGRIWVNRTNSNITDFGLLTNLNGGKVIFNTNNVWTTLPGRQILQSFYNANTRENNSFYDIEVNNPDGISQVGVTKINSQLTLTNGKFFLNNANLLIGSNANTLVRVLNYNNNNYIVTEALATSAVKPSVHLLNNPSFAQVIFPVGFSDQHYTPMAVNNGSGNRSFTATVFENVYDNGTSGNVRNNGVVRATWQLRKLDASISTLNVQLQHGVALETSTFTARRQLSFVKNYAGGQWNLPTGASPNFVAGGYLTTGPSVSNAFVHNRAQVFADSTVVTMAKWIVETDRFRIPNAFSPNGDNVNDRWVIPELNWYPNCKVNIYNRYGQPVFSSNNGYSVPWDGTYNGQPLPIATYYYVIELEPGAPLLSGYVMILR